MNDNFTIVQNQSQFSVPIYKKHTTPLPIALKNFGFPECICRLNLESFWAGVALYFCSFNFDVVVSVSLMPSFAYGFLSRILKKKGSIHVCKEFYLESNPKKLSIKKKLRLYLLRFSLKNVDAIILNASSEVDEYSKKLSIPIDRFYFIAWPSNISSPKLIRKNQGYFLSVGRSLRDWVTFFKAIKYTSYRYIIIATAEDAELFPTRDNVTIMTDVRRDVYLNVLIGAKGVILPLKPTIRSTGQASFLEAMAYGKPVIASDVVGVHDYLLHEVNALLCTPGDENSLSECIKRVWEDPKLCNKISFNGFNDINDKFNKYKYAENMLKTIELIQQNRVIIEQKKKDCK